MHTGYPHWAQLDLGATAWSDQVATGVITQGREVMPPFAGYQWITNFNVKTCTDACSAAD